MPPRSELWSLLERGAMSSHLLMDSQRLCYPFLCSQLLCKTDLVPKYRWRALKSVKLRDSKDISQSRLASKWRNRNWSTVSLAWKLYVLTPHPGASHWLNPSSKCSCLAWPASPLSDTQQLLNATHLRFAATLSTPGLGVPLCGTLTSCC